jgi:hypothetical protein
MKLKVEYSEIDVGEDQPDLCGAQTGGTRRRVLVRKRASQRLGRANGQQVVLEYVLDRPFAEFRVLL